MHPNQKFRHRKLRTKEKPTNFLFSHCFVFSLLACVKRTYVISLSLFLVRFVSFVKLLFLFCLKRLVLYFGRIKSFSHLLSQLLPNKIRMNFVEIFLFVLSKPFSKRTMPSISYREYFNSILQVIRTYYFSITPRNKQFSILNRCHRDKVDLISHV